MFFNFEQMIEDYPFETCSTHVKKALTWIADNCDEMDFELFGNPEFYGMPKELYRKLTQDDLSYIQLYGNDYLNDDSPSLNA